MVTINGHIRCLDMAVWLIGYRVLGMGFVASGSILVVGNFLFVMLVQLCLVESFFSNTSTANPAPDNPSQHTAEMEAPPIETSDALPAFSAQEWIGVGKVFSCSVEHRRPSLRTHSAWLPIPSHT